MAQRMVKNLQQKYEEALQGMYDAISEMDEMILKLNQVKPSEVGLDARCGGLIYFSDDLDCIYIQKHRKKSFNYYGGFEYIKEDAYEFGDYVQYDRYTDDKIEEICIKLQEILNTDAN